MKICYWPKLETDRIVKVTEYVVLISCWPDLQNMVGFSYSYFLLTGYNKKDLLKPVNKCWETENDSSVILFMKRNWEEEKGKKQNWQDFKTFPCSLLRIFGNVTIFFYSVRIPDSEAREKENANQMSRLN